MNTKNINDILDKVSKFVKNKKVQRIAIIIAISIVALIIIKAVCFTTRIDYEGEANLDIEYGAEIPERVVTVVLEDRFMHTTIFSKQAVVNKTWKDPYNSDMSHYLYGGSIWGHSSTVELTTTYVDTTPPTLTLTDADKPVKISSTGKFDEPGYRAKDSHDGDLTDKVQVKYINGEILYSVSDKAGNSTAASRPVVLGDESAPVITLKGGEPYYVKLGEDFVEPGYTAVDDVDGDITGSVSITGQTVDTNKAGVYTKAYSVVDGSGNSSRVVRTILVVDVLPSEIDVEVKNEHANTASKFIYLTFDDGPGPYTADLLDVLDKYNVKATFFVTNQFPEYIDLIKEEHDRGHTVAIHTYWHNYEMYDSIESYMTDFNNMQDVIIEQTGESTSLFRFPGGSSNTISKRYCEGIMTDLSKYMTDEGYIYFDWNVSSEDAGSAKTSTDVYNNVVNGCKYNNVSIVLQHDTHDFSVEAVESIIKWGLNNGYTFAPLTEETGTIHHKIYN